MAVLTTACLNRMSPCIRQRILLKKDNVLYYEKVFDNNIIVPDTSVSSSYDIGDSSSVNVPLHSNIMTYTSSLNISSANDGYNGNVRRLHYAKTWDKLCEINAPNIWEKIENPENNIIKRWNNSKRNEFCNYLDYTNSIFGTSRSLVNVLGSIVTGNGVGLTLGEDRVGVVSNFDIAQALSGRIISTISGNETELGTFGLKAAAISMANNALYKTQKNVVNELIDFGKSKLVDLIKGTDNAKLDLTSNSITNKPGVLDDILNQTGLGGVTTTIANDLGVGSLLGDIGNGFLVPPNGKYIEIDADASIFDIDRVEGDIYSKTIIPNLDKFLYNSSVFGNNSTTYDVDINDFVLNYSRKVSNEALIKWSGNLSVKKLFENINRSKFGPGYSANVNGNFISSPTTYFQGLGAMYYDEIGSEINTYSNITGTGEGKTVLTWQETINGISKEDTDEVDYDYVSYKGFTNDRIINDDKNTLISKTQQLFLNNKINTIVSGFGKLNELPSDIQSAVSMRNNQIIMNTGISKGRNLLKRSYWEGNNNSSFSNGYEDPFCRVWTWHKQYRRLSNLIRPFWNDEDGNGGESSLEGEPMKLEDLQNNVWFVRPYLKNFIENTVLQDNGFIKIAPYGSDWDENNTTFSKENIHRYMFSLENLAWKDISLENNLCPSQIGPNGGRLMWFAPYNLKFSEASSNNLNRESFIGRGEQVITYVDSTRTGNLSFTMVVDHSSFLNYIKKDEFDNSEDTDQQLLRWNAGCDVPDVFNNPNSNNKKGFNPVTDFPQSQDTPLDEPPALDTSTLPPTEKTIGIVRVYYPNDYSGIDLTGELALTYLYQGCGVNPVNYRNDKQSGYEMNKTYTLSNHAGVDMEKISDSTIISNIKSNAEITEQKLRVSIQQGITPNIFLTENTDIPIKIDMTENRTLTDKLNIENGGEKYTFEGIGVEFQHQYLPRIRYYSNQAAQTDGYGWWDISDNGLNVDKGGLLYSFKEFYDILMGDVNSDNYKKVKGDFENAVEIYVSGNASEHGYVVDNKKLAKNRATTLARFIEEKLKIKIPDKNITINNTDGKTNQSNTPKGITDESEILAKQARFAEIKIVVNPSKSDNMKDLPQVNENGDIRNNVVVENNVIEDSLTYMLNKKRISRLRYDEERKFFRALENTDDLLMNKLTEKLNFFIPAFHSTSPEGFNARLGFLNQCMRQGPTGSGTDSNILSASNLSFGRPPVCVLRVGDFYHSRIYIESLNIDFEPLQFDLNSEGIGVQPMLANISMSFIFMGGQDISSAISRLQNAITFNFYANQSVYDDRSDFYINKKNEGVFVPEDLGDRMGPPKLEEKPHGYYDLYDPYKYKNVNDAYDK